MLHQSTDVRRRVLIEWKHWETVIVGLIVVHWILFCTYWKGMPSETLNAIVGVKAALVGAWV